MVIMATSATVLYQTEVSANDSPILTNQPDEAFLEFLSSMSEVEGEFTDPLDMLDLEDEPMLDHREPETNLPDQQLINQNDSDVEGKMKTKIFKQENNL
jgi:hypothetical protein